MITLTIRNADINDLNRIAEIEALCFPPAEKASFDSLEKRIQAFPESFFVAEFDGELIGFINGCSTNSSVIYDELFSDITCHDPQGKTLAVFGLDVIPEHRKKGIAAQLMDHFILAAKKNHKETVILTCKEYLVSYYESFGFINNGLSGSTHGNAQWFDMTLELG